MYKNPKLLETIEEEGGDDQRAVTSTITYTYSLFAREKQLALLQWASERS